MIEFQAERPIWTDQLKVYAKRVYGDGVRAIVCDGLKEIDVPKHGMWPEFIALPLDENAGQSLFDALWAAGFRPHNGESSVAHVDAIKNHLADMRLLALPK